MVFKKLLFLVLSCLLLAFVSAADFPCDCFEEGKKYGIVNTTESILEIKEAVDDAATCCGSCKNLTGCHSWTWGEDSKNCTMMTNYDYALEAEKHYAGTISKSAKHYCFDENNFCAYNGHRVCEQESAYRGTRTVTRKGFKCQNWNATEPHDPKPIFKEADNIKKWDIGNHHYCRVAGWHSPWCHTTDENERWDYCFDDCYTGTLTEEEQKEAENKKEEQKEEEKEAENKAVTDRQCNFVLLFLLILVGDFALK